MMVGKARQQEQEVSATHKAENASRKWGRGYKAFSPRPMSDVLPPARLSLPKAPYPHPTLPSSTSNWGPCVEIHFGGHFSFKTHINMKGW